MAAKRLKCETCEALRDSLAHERRRAEKLEERLDVLMGMRAPNGSQGATRSWAADPEVAGGRPVLTVNGTPVPVVERDGKPGFMVGNTWVDAKYAAEVDNLFEQYMNGAELPETDLLGGETGH